MKVTYAKYEHSVIGFPKVVLKFDSINGNGYSNPYIVIKDIIKPWSWSYNQETTYNIENELDRFDRYVRCRFSGNISVQG